MTNEEKRIAIAEVCGWKRDTTRRDVWFPPIRPGYLATSVDALPNYLNDLNAMHQAEKCLTATQAADYDSTLWITLRQEWNQTGIPKLATAWHATATQRANAFLKTLGLYTDEI